MAGSGRTRTWRWLGAALVAAMALAVCGRWIDYPALAGGHKGDEATYILMAFSLADDHDMVYTRADLERFDRLYHRPGDTTPHTPNGVFLKERYALTWSPVKTLRPESEGLAYGKAFIYPLVAAPFVWAGGLWGMLMCNVLLLALSTAAAIAFARARVPGWKGVALGAVFIIASNVPVWTVWLTSETFNFTCVMLGYFLWLYKLALTEDARRRSAFGGAWTDWAAALLIGLATFSKPSHAPLVVPMVLYWLWRRDVLKIVAVSAAFVAGSAGLYAINGLHAGYMNYQGAAANLEGGRRSFYEAFPFDEAGHQLRTSNASTMETNDSDADTILSSEVLQNFPRTIYYFLFGRDAGFVPYYFPGAVMLLLWLWRWRRAEAWQWCTAFGVLGSIAGLVLIAPITWNGGGGPPGSRYVLGLYPPLLFLLPAGISAMSVVVTAIGGMFFTASLTISPFQASREPWVRPGQWPLRLLPTELTMMNDIPVRLNGRRGRIRFRNDDPFVYVYYMDEQAYDAEGQGFWIAPGAPADVVFRVYPDIKQITLTVHSDIANTFTGTVSGVTQTVDLKPRESKTLTFDTTKYVHSDGADVHEVLLQATNGYRPSDRGAPDSRPLGVFVEVGFVPRR